MFARTQLSFAFSAEVFLQFFLMLTDKPLVVHVPEFREHIARIEPLLHQSLMAEDTGTCVRLCLAPILQL